MKFAVALTLASTAMAGSIAVRDSQYVQDVMATVGKDIDAVKSAADSYSGDKSDIVKAAEKLIADLKEGKTKAEAGSDLDLNDAIMLKAPVESLTQKGTDLTQALESKKDQVEKAGECKTVQKNIAAIDTNSKSLIDAVLEKVPEGPAREIASGLASGLTKVLGEAEAAYKDCNDASGGSSSSGSATGTGSATQTTGSATETTGSATPTGASSSDCATGTGSPMPTGTSGPTVPTGAAAVYAPAGIVAAVAAALAL